MQSIVFLFILFLFCALDGIVYVVDPGLSKQNMYNARTRVESLLGMIFTSKQKLLLKICQENDCQNFHFFSFFYFFAVNR